MPTVAEILADGHDLLDGSLFTQTFVRTSEARDPWNGVIEATGILRDRVIGLDDGSMKQVYIEPSRTNEQLRSEEFDNAAWSKGSHATATANDAGAPDAPDGTRTMDKIAFTAGGSAGVSYAQQNVTLSGGTASKTVTVSCWLAGSGTVRLKNTHGGVVDNFSSDITLTSAPVRHIFTVTNSSGAGNGNQICGVVDGSTFAGATCYAWGFQTEQGQATTYIKTEAAVVTREGDDLQIDLSTLPGGGMSATEGEIFMVFVPYRHANPTLQQEVLVGNSNLFLLFTRIGGGTSVLVRRGNSGSFNNISDTTAGRWDADVQKHFGVLWDASNVELWQEGALDAQVAKSASYDVISTLYVGQAQTGANRMTGALAAFYFPTQLSSADRTTLVNAINAEAGFWLDSQTVPLDAASVASSMPSIEIPAVIPLSPLTVATAAPSAIISVPVLLTAMALTAAGPKALISRPVLLDAANISVVAETLGVVDSLAPMGLGVSMPSITVDRSEPYLGQKSILQAAFNRLLGYAPLLNLTGAHPNEATNARVWNHVPQRTAAPFIVVRWVPSTDWDTKDSLGFRGEIEVDTWVNDQSEATLLDIMDAIRNALQDYDLQISGGHTVLCQFRAGSVVQQTDGFTHRGVMTFDYIAST